MKKSFCILLTMLMFIGLWPMNVTATSTVWDGTIAEAYAGGDGSELNPYQIANGQQLAYFAQQVNLGTYYTDVYFELTNDIVLNNTTNWQTWDTCEPMNTWTPIGSEYSFLGIFDGGNHTISGLYVNSTGYAGLFGIALSTSTIKNVRVIKSYVVTSGQYFYAGAIVGHSGGNIQNCYNSGTVVGESAGGICGNLEGANASITNSSNSGTIIASFHAGGIAADIEEWGSVEFCYNTGEVKDSGDWCYVGGISGDASLATISNCYNTGLIASKQDFGGGLVGHVDESIIRLSYNAGRVTGAVEATGLIAGYSSSHSIISDTYYLDYDTVLRGVGQYRDFASESPTTTYDVDIPGTTPFTDAQMQVQSNFTGFDFTSVWGWAQVGDKLYPYSYPVFGPLNITLTVTTLGGAARFDKTAIRFGASISFEDMATLRVGDTVDYGFSINGLMNNALAYTDWTKLSAASTTVNFAGFEWTAAMDEATTTEALTGAIRATGIKVYEYDATTITFAIILNNLPMAAQDSLWVIEPYVTVNATDTSLGTAKYNSINRILEDIASGTYTA